jgi:hypothetical protein
MTALARNHVKSPENTEKPSPRRLNHAQSAEKPDSSLQGSHGGTKIRRLHSFMKYPG